MKLIIERVVELEIWTISKKILIEYYAAAEGVLSSLSCPHITWQFTTCKKIEWSRGRERVDITRGIIIKYPIKKYNIHIQVCAKWMWNSVKILCLLNIIIMCVCRKKLYISSLILDIIWSISVVRIWWWRLCCVRVDACKWIGNVNMIRDMTTKAVS